MTIIGHFMSIAAEIRNSQPKFEYQNNLNVIIMTVSNNHHPMLKFITVWQKILTNPYVGVLVSFLLILPSLYIILSDVKVFRKEYIFLAIGIPLYIKSLNKIFDNILNGNDNKFK